MISHESYCNATIAYAASYPDHRDRSTFATTTTRSPIPEEGLPPGWTMEQWSWYGEDYLRNK